MITKTSRGLYCPTGDFYIDPHVGVSKAIITHCHTDHLRPASQNYLMSVASEPLARERIGVRANIETLAFGEIITIGGVKVSLHPAGHILGSAQVRIEHQGEVTVVSGDYKLEVDRTCETFETVTCHTFITESTFAQPRYKWQPQSKVFTKLNDWWQLNAAWGRTSVVFAYSLGKAQRILAGVDPSIAPILVYHTVEKFNHGYKRAGIQFPEYEVIADDILEKHKGKGALIVAPQEIRKYGVLEKIGEYETAFASGWVSASGVSRSTMYDKGFQLSDHADWNGLLTTIQKTGASKIYVMHGFVDTLVDYLKKEGYEAYGW